MKKATILYIFILVLFLGVIMYFLHSRLDSSNYFLVNYTQPSQIQKININTATTEQLQIIPGIGPAISQRIIAYRSEYGPFTCIDDVANVKGVGKSLLSRLETYITIGD